MPTLFNPAPTPAGHFSPLNPAGWRRKKRSQERRDKAASIRRGPGVDVRRIKDKKLKGKLRHVERIVQEAQQKAIKVNEWLLPSEGGMLQAEGGPTCMPGTHEISGCIYKRIIYRICRIQFCEEF